MTALKMWFNPVICINTNSKKEKLLFTSKIFLWGLLGLLIPLIIHLWNKQKPKVISIGSLELMESFEADHSRRLRFSDWWRLLLRCLILGVLVVLLMQPYLLKQETIPAPDFYNHIVLIDPNLEEEQFVTESVNALNRPAFWMQKGWPPRDSLEWGSIEKSVSTDSPFTDYFAFLNELDFADTVTLFGENQSANFIGTQVNLPFVLNWKLLPNGESESEVMDTQLSVTADSLKIGFEQGNITKNNSNKASWSIIKAALESIAEQTQMTLVFDSLNPSCFFCLADEVKGDGLGITSNCKSGFDSDDENVKFVLVKQNTDISHPQLFRGSEFGQFKLLGDFRRSNSNINSLPLVLSDFFLQEQILPATENKERVSIAEEQLILPQAKGKRTIAQAKVIEKKDRQHFPFWLLLVALVLVERFWSIRSKVV